LVQKHNTAPSGPKPSSAKQSRDVRNSRKIARILLIDDDDIVTQTLAMILRTDGHIVTTASNGTDALKIFSANTFDLIITDLFMPLMSGWDIIRRIRLVSTDIPVIVLTGSIEAITTSISHSFDELGVVDLLMKPVRMADLLARVQSVVGRMNDHRMST
jgi:DNA-binding response OmpR family regulator